MTIEAITGNNELAYLIRGLQTVQHSAALHFFNVTCEWDDWWQIMGVLKMRSQIWI